MRLYDNSELVIGLVAAVGANPDPIIAALKTRLTHFNYTTKEIRISEQVISSLHNYSVDPQDNYKRISQLMDYGNEIRAKSNDKGVLANGVAARIFENRSSQPNSHETEPLPRTAFIVRSLKTPEEVHRLRYLYSSSFYLIGIYSEEKARLKYLCKHLLIRNEAHHSRYSIDAPPYVGTSYANYLFGLIADTAKLAAIISHGARCTPYPCPFKVSLTCH